MTKPSRTARYQLPRSRINMDQPIEVRSWSRHLGVSAAKLRETVDKVGNSAAAVRKELASRPRATL